MTKIVSKYIGLLRKGSSPTLIPPDATPSGILKNTILGIPKAEINLAKKAVKLVSNTAKKVQEKVKGRATEIIKNPKTLLTEAKALAPKPEIYMDKFISHTKGTPRKYTDEQIKKEQEKFVSTVAGVTGSEDFVARSIKGEISERVITFLKNESNPQKIRNAIKSLGAPEASLDTLSSRLAKSKTTDEVKQAIIEESTRYKAFSDEAPFKGDGSDFKTSQDNPLALEARKYKSAEEFIKSQGTPLYHRTNEIFNDFNLDKKSEISSGIHFFDDIGRSNSEGAIKRFGKNQIEAYTNAKIADITPTFPDGNTPSYENLPKELREAMNFTSRDMKIARIKELGYGGYKSGNEIVVFDPKNIKTKEQLTDFYNKAVGEIQKTPIPRIQISDEGIPMSSTNISAERQRALIEGRIKPGQPMPKSTANDSSSRALRQALETKSSKPGQPSPGGGALSIEQILQRTGGETPLSQIQRLSQTGQKEGAESLSDIIEKELPTVNEKIGFLDYLRTPEYVLRRVGLGDEARLLRQQYDKYLKELPENIEKITQWAKSLPDESNQRIFKYLDGQPVEPRNKGGVRTDSGLTPSEKKVADEIKVWLKEFADRLGLPEDKRVTHYITHLFEDNFIQKEFDPNLAKLIQGRIPGSVYDPFLEERLGAQGYVEDTWRALDAYVKRATRKIHMDPALDALKKGALQSDISVINYIQRYASRINLRPTELENLIDTTFKQIFGYKQGVRPINRISQKLRQWVYRGTLGLNIGSAMRNLTQGVNTYAELGERFAIKGYLDFVRNGTKELKDVGVLQDQLVQDRTISAIKTTMQKVDKGLFLFFDLAEKINRGAAYYGGKARALSRGATEEEAVAAGKDLVRKTQFAFGSIDTPVALQDDIARTMAQLQSFTVKQIEYLGGKIGRREFAGIARYIGGSLIMLFTIGRLFGMRPKDMIPSLRFAAPPTLGLPAELSRELFTGEDQYGAPLTPKSIFQNLGNKALPLLPASVQIKKTLQGIKAVSEGKDTTASGKTKYKIKNTRGNMLRAALFGKYNLPEAREYYKKQDKKSTKTKSSRYSF